MKTIPHGTGFPITSIILKRGSSEGFASIPQSLCPDSQGSEIAFFTPSQSCYVRSDAVATPSAKISFQINLDRPTSVPFRYAVPRANIPPYLATGWTAPKSNFNTLVPLKPKKPGLQRLLATTDYDDIAKRKKYLWNPSRSSLKKTGKRAHNSTWRLTGVSVFRKERGCPNGRSYASSRRDRQPRLSLFFRPRHQPLPTSDAPRVTASHLAINTHHCCRVGHTRPGAGGNPRRSSLPRTNRETPQWA